jgi:hypothetical protein
MELDMSHSIGRNLLTLSLAGISMFVINPAQARECLLDTNNDGAATAGTDTDGAALSTNIQDTACGTAAVATSSGATFNTQDTDAATALGTLSLAVGPDTLAVGNDAIAGLLSGGGVTAASRTTAVGASSNAGSTEATAIGYGARAIGSSATALGAGANARGAGGIAIGAAADATTPGSTVIGNGAISTGQNAIAIGNLARANGTSAVAHGDNAVASGTNSIAYGSNSLATGVQATSFGTSAKAVRDNSVAIGNNALAQGASGTAVGNSSVVTADNATALGTASRATHAGSTAVGAGAVTSDNNQVMLGGAGTSVVIADINASTAAQQGPVDVVTVDASGTLGRQQVATAQSVADTRVAMHYLAAVSDAQFSALENQLGDLSFRLDEMDQSSRAGVAAAMAMGGMMVVPDSNLSVSVNVATYRGEQGFSGGIVARVAPKVYVSGAVTGSSHKKSTGARVGVAFGL